MWHNSLNRFGVVKFGSHSDFSQGLATIGEGHFRVPSLQSPEITRASGPPVPFRCSAVVLVLFGDIYIHVYIYESATE